MNVITVNFKHIEIYKYTRNEPLILKILFNDGLSDRSIIKTTSIENIEQITSETINEIKKIEKEAHFKKSDEFLDTVQVRFGNDEEKVEEKLCHAFSRVKEEIRKMRNPDAQGLLQKIAMIQGSKYLI